MEGVPLSDIVEHLFKIQAQAELQHGDKYNWTKLQQSNSARGQALCFKVNQAISVHL